ncbi:MAG: DHH family phosphoesterase [Prevotella sp.]|jgi:phosphoesterase RecJ-like protein|nr:DHH family phosphoesterase [Prevotella sp.]
MNIELLTDNEVAQLRDLISLSKNIAIVCHMNADGDALGSTLAWAEYLNMSGKNATVIVPDMYPDYLQWLPGAQQSIRFDKKKDEAKKVISEADLICCMDLNNLSRTGAELQQVTEQSTAKFLLIDHHLDPVIESQPQISFPTMSSTSEIVFRLIWQLGGYESMTKNMATNIYCGMMTDTGGFTYNSNAPEIYFIISQLLAKDIDKDKIYRNIYHVFSVDRLRLTGYVMYQKLKVLTPLKASYYTLSKEELRRFHFIKGDAEGLVNMPLQIKGHRLSISLREDSEKPNVVWVSLRSVDDFPCNEMAEQFFNGGGHKNASGGRLYCSLSEAEKIVRKAIKAFSDRL